MTSPVEWVMEEMSFQEEVWIELVGVYGSSHILEAQAAGSLREREKASWKEDEINNSLCMLMYSRAGSRERRGNPIH